MLSNFLRTVLAFILLIIIIVTSFLGEEVDEDVVYEDKFSDDESESV
jgi:hypothetical protein